MQNDEMDDAEIIAIRRAFGADSLVSQVAQRDVRSWMNSANIEVLGAFCQLVVDRPAANDKILPPLERADYDEFLRRYLARCIKENPDREWAHGRYLAAHRAVSWILGLWRRSELPPVLLRQWKVWLADLYLNGDEGIRDGVVNGALEHLFEEKKIRDIFDDWRDHPELSVAHELASEWSARRGSQAE